MTGILDNIAWIINLDKQLCLNRMKISLHLENCKGNPNQKKHSDFIKALEKDPNNDSLVTTIVCDANQAFLDAIYFFRDNLVHREYFQAVRISGGRNGNVIKISYEGNKTLEKYLHNKQLIDCCTITLPNKSVYLDPLRLIEQFEKDFIVLTNTILLQIRTNLQSSQTALYQRLKFPCEPYY